MDAERIRALRLAHPFKPFVLLMEDGRRFLIDKPYYIAIAPKGNVILVSTEGDGAEWFGPDRVRDAILLESVGARENGGASSGGNLK